MTIYTIQFGLYLVLMLGIGYYSMKKTRNNKDFLIGGRTLGPVTTAISAGASDMSSWLLLGLPGAVFAGGLVEGVWISFGLVLGAYGNWLFVAGRLRALTERLDAVGSSGVGPSSRRSGYPDPAPNRKIPLYPSSVPGCKCGFHRRR
jgi:sodium/proline symporter